jgi:hypothetical protein
MFGESYRTQELVNANGQEGQGNLVFTFIIAAAVLTSWGKNLKREFDETTPAQRECVVQRISSLSSPMNCFDK